MVMVKKEIGRTREYVSAIGLGTWSIRDYSRAKHVFLEGINNGIDNIDTAEMYDSGRAEVFIGEILRETGKENVFVTTKMLPVHLVSRDEVVKAAKNSLKRLGVDVVDLFLIHWPNPSIPISIQVRNFEAIIDEGLARYIGVSNFYPEDLEEAVTATKKADIVVDQVHYSIYHRYPVENGLNEICNMHGITIQAYNVIERGRVAKDKVLGEIALKYNKTPIQVALNYAISNPRVIAIVKTENISHLHEILGSVGWNLSEQDMEFIRLAIRGD
jgi:diketogulonate reductase-like aldo/keto reductase